jgi:hypothetical protein
VSAQHIETLYIDCGFSIFVTVHVQVSVQVCALRMRIITSECKLALVNCTGYQKGESVWLYRPTRTKGRSPTLQFSRQVPYKVITRINDVVYMIQRTPTSRMMVVHFDRLSALAWSRSRRAAVRRGKLERLECDNRENLETAERHKYTDYNFCLWFYMGVKHGL